MPKGPSKSDLVPDLAGVVVDHGRLKLETKLGNGAYGVTYRARNLTLDGPPFLAVKCVQRAGMSDHQLAYQRKEVNIHRRVTDHRNVVTLLRTFEEKGLLFMVMELASSGDMFAAITETFLYLGRDNLIRHVFLGLVDAVIHCHSLGVAHRDLKPENILVMDDGLRLVIADFGLATMEQTCKDWGCGSSFYMSPECHGLDKRVKSYAAQPNDVWALGVILINLTCGRNPWRTSTRKDPTFSAFLDNPDFLRSILPLSRGANEILKRCFDLNPQNRITAIELKKQVIAVDRFTMSNAELIRSPESVRAAAKAAWGEMEKARAKRSTPIVPFPDSPQGIAPDSIRSPLPRLVINVRQPSDAHHDTTAGPSTSTSTRGIYDHNSDSVTTFNDSSRRPSLFSGSTDSGPSAVNTPRWTPADLPTTNSLEELGDDFALDGPITAVRKIDEMPFLSSRKVKEKAQPASTPEPKASSPMLNMSRFFRKVKW